MSEFLSAIRDITERQRSQQQILNLNRKLEEAATVAESANRAKSVLRSTMSHEIRTPMNAILGYAQLMSRDPSLSEHANTNFKIIGRSGEHLLSASRILALFGAAVSVANRDSPGISLAVLLRRMGPAWSEAAARQRL